MSVITLGHFQYNDKSIKNNTMNNLAFIFLYLDAGTGSLIVQLTIAAVTAAIFFFRGLRERIVNLFKRFRRKDQ
jgi:hypothetical protein